MRKSRCRVVAAYRYLSLLELIVCCQGFGRRFWFCKAARE